MFVTKMSPKSFAC